MASAELSVAWPRLTPDQAAELRAKADALYAAEDYTAAEELFGQLVASGFEPAWCRFQWGRIAGRLGRWAEAVERLDQAIDIEQPNSWAYFERSQALVKSLGEEAAAIGDLVRFVETAPAALAPAHFDALVRAAHAAFDRQAYIEAEKLYTFYH